MDDDREKQSVTLCDALDRILSSGIVAHGDIIISVADVDLLRISLRALVAATDAICNDYADSLVESNIAQSGGSLHD